MSDQPAQSRRADLASVADAGNAQSLWRSLIAYETDAEFGDAWLGLAMQMISGAVAGALAIAPRHPGAEPLIVERTPDGDAGLREVARAALNSSHGTVRSVAGARPASRLTYPVRIDDAVTAAVVVEVAAGGGSDPRDAMRQLQWASAWLRDYWRREELAANDVVVERTELALDLLAAILEELQFKDACRISVNELASRFECERVSIGFRRGRRARIACISHSAHFGKSMNLVRLIAAAMDEAVDQRSLVIYPPSDEDEVLMTRSHSALSAAHGAGHVLTVPIFVRDHFAGAVTFERARDNQFDQSSVDLADAVVAILGPALLDKRAADQPLPVKAARSAADAAVALFGPGYWGRKIAFAVSVAVIAFCVFAHGEYRISADSVVEGAVQRSIVAPFDGFISNVAVKAGDHVEEGEILAELDDRDLLIERLRLTTEYQRQIAEYDRALSEGKRADSVRFRSLADEASAQVDLVDELLARTRLAAPFPGLVVSGDLSQSIGAPVKRGEVLFEIAPLEDYRVVARIDESQIADVYEGQQGALLLTSLPDVSVPLVIENITPVTEAYDGRLVFLVDARLTEAAARIGPGMEGVAKFEAGRRRLVWIWFRSLLHWFQIKSWAWMP